MFNFVTKISFKNKRKKFCFRQFLFMSNADLSLHLIVAEDDPSDEDCMMSLILS